MADEIGGTGPPPIPNGQGKDYLRREEPYRLVNLDAGAFDWIWRIVEAKYLQHQNSSIPTAREVSKRAVIAFREAAGTLTTEPPKSRRRLVKTPKDV